MPTDLLLAPVAEGFVLLDQVTRAEISRHGDADAGFGAATTALAEGGGRLSLVAGRYELTAPIAWPSRSALVGAGTATELVVGGGTGIRVEGAKQSRVADLRLLAADGAEVGVELVTCGDCRVEDVTCEGFALAGIRVGEHSFLCAVRGCSLGGCGIGVQLVNLRRGPAGDFLPNLVSDCVIYGHGTGTAVLCDGAIVVNLCGIIVFNVALGFHLVNDSNSVSLTGSRTFQLTDKALLVEKSHELNVSGNIFCWQVHEGIVVRDSWWGSIVGNNVIDNGSYNCGQPDFTFCHRDLAEEPPHYDGIRLENTCGFTVTGNAVFNWSAAPPMEVPIRLDERCHDNVVSANAGNFYRSEGPVEVPAAAGLAASNVGYGPGPWNRGGAFLPEHWCQSWVPSHLKHFIEADRVPAVTPENTWEQLRAATPKG